MTAASVSYDKHMTDLTWTLTLSAVVSPETTESSLENTSLGLCTVMLQQNAKSQNQQQPSRYALQTDQNLFSVKTLILVIVGVFVTAVMKQRNKGVLAYFPLRPKLQSGFCMNQKCYYSCNAAA